MSASTSGPTTTEPSDPRTAARLALLARFERVSWPLMSILALVYLFTYSAQAIWYRPSDEWFVLATWFSLLLWLVFAIDLIVRFIITPLKRGFFRKNWLDTITVVVPQFRALRVLMAFNQHGILAKRGKGVLSGGAITTAAIGSFIVIWVGSIMVLNAERTSTAANIKSFPDAIWWAFETVTTVGYGDFTPVTWLGRGYAVLIMFLGISIVGVISASLAATLVKQNNPAPPSPAQEVMTELGEIKAMIAALESKLGAAQAPAAPPAAPPAAADPPPAS